MEKPALRALWRQGTRELRVYVSGKLEFLEDGKLMPNPRDLILVNRIPELMAQAREEGRSEK